MKACGFVGYGKCRLYRRMMTEFLRVAPLIVKSRTAAFDNSD
jgi:hypothetical protein